MNDHPEQLDGYLQKPDIMKTQPAKNYSRDMPARNQTPDNTSQTIEEVLQAFAKYVRHHERTGLGVGMNKHEALSRIEAIIEKAQPKFNDVYGYTRHPIRHVGVPRLSLDDEGFNEGVRQYGHNLQQVLGNKGAEDE